MANAFNSGPLHWGKVAIASPLRAILEWYRVAQERAEMKQMPADRLSDVGLTKRDVEWETARPFWQAKRES